MTSPLSPIDGTAARQPEIESSRQTKQEWWENGVDLKASPALICAALGCDDCDGMSMRGETAPSVANRGAMTATIICACVMQGADTTIANVCKPAHPGQHVGIAGSDLVGADILHRLFGDRSQTRRDRFVDDSALEGTRFELPVPREMTTIFEPSCFWFL